MALQFQEICDIIDDTVGTNDGSYPLAVKARDINLAALKLQMIAIQAEGKFQVDDANHTKDPVLTCDLIASQRDYHFSQDEQDNYILDIYKVMVKDAGGSWVEMGRIDQQKEDGVDNLVAQMLNGADATGTPVRYDKSWNGIFLDPVPSYSWRTTEEGEQGLKLWVNREHSYFISTDTTKVLGFGHAYHEYLALRPSYVRAMRKGLFNKNDLKRDVLEMEADIKKYFSRRAKDEQLRITPQSINPI
jgi:hypothetical protein